MSWMATRAGQAVQVDHVWGGRETCGGVWGGAQLLGGGAWPGEHGGHLLSKQC